MSKYVSEISGNKIRYMLISEAMCEKGSTPMRGMSDLLIKNIHIAGKELSIWHMNAVKEVNLMLKNSFEMLKCYIM